LHPSPGRAWVDLGDLPDQLRHAGLLDREPSADGEGGSVQPDQGSHRGGPVGPVLDIAEDIPHELRRRIYLDTVFIKHVPNGTSCFPFCIRPYATRALAVQAEPITRRMRNT